MLQYWLQDDATTNTRNVSTKLKDLEEQNSRMEQHIQQLNRRLNESEEGEHRIYSIINIIYRISL